jgi:hypothetical protein
MVNNKNNILQLWVVEAIKSLGGKGRLVDVAKVIWTQHHTDLEAMGDHFYTWQYDMRWCATRLRKLGILKDTSESQKGLWELK